MNPLKCHIEVSNVPKHSVSSYGIDLQMTGHFLGRSKSPSISRNLATEVNEELHVAVLIHMFVLKPPWTSLPYSARINDNNVK